MARGDCPTTLSSSLLCKDCLRLSPFHTSPVVRCVVAPAHAAQMVYWVGRAVTRKVRAPTRDAPRRVSAVSLRMAEALAAFGLDWALWCQVCFHRHSQVTEFFEGSHLGHLRAPHPRHNEVGVGGLSLAGSWSRQPERSCITPETSMSRAQLLQHDALRYALAEVFN